MSSNFRDDALVGGCRYNRRGACWRPVVPASRADCEGILEQCQLDDGTADRFLLDAAGATLLVFVSSDCGNCRLARQRLPELSLPPVQRLAWIDAGENRGLVERYEVFHLPALFLVRDGVFYGALHAKLEAADIGRQIALALQSYPAELP